MSYKRNSPIPVIEGGTGDLTLTVHGVLIGETTSSIATTSAGTTGQVLTGVTGSDPVWASPAASSISITGNTGGALTGAAFTFTGGTTGLSFGGSGSTETLSGTLVVANGGTNATSFATTDGTVIFDGTRLVTIGTGTSGQILTSAGAGVAPSYQTASGTTIAITGDSGGALTSGSFTFTGGTTGLSFAGSGTTETLGGTLVVSNGGTGRASATAYAVVTGGTTSTGALQSIASVGTSGQVLTSNGASALPTFQTISGGITTINGDTGSITGSTVTVRANHAGLACGSGVLFSGSGTTMTLQVTGSGSNTIVGSGSGNLTLSGTNNVVFGEGSFTAPTTAQYNTVLGGNALTANTTGNYNVVVGNAAFAATVAGSTGNVVIGTFAATGSTGTMTNNTYVGYSSGGFSASSGGTSNTCIGYNTGITYATNESNNICIGGSEVGVVGDSGIIRIGSSSGVISKCFIGGITGVVTTGANAIINASNQLGVLASSKRFKNDIQDMSDESSAVLNLRPVTFVWNKDSSDGLKDSTDDRQFGVIAEEAAEIVPSLVNYDNDGNPFSFKYSELPALLLNELQKAIKRIEALEKKLEEK